MTRPWIIIPAHNRRELTVCCLAVLERNGDLATCDAVVVDDGSSDGTADAVRARFPSVRVLTGDGSLFWTGAVALAMEEAKRSSLAAPVIWLNDDCHPHPGALPAILGLLARRPEALVGPACIDPATGAAVPSGFTGRTTHLPRADGPLSVAGLSGFCVGIGLDAWRKLGAPDARRFPHYGGDTAYTLRASRAGHPVLLLGDAAIDLVDYAGGPAGLGARIRPGDSFSASLGRVFHATNSPYRLPTLFALHALKYGQFTGALSAATKALSWAFEFGRAWTHRRDR